MESPLPFESLEETVRNLKLKLSVLDLFEIPQEYACPTVFARVSRADFPQLGARGVFGGAKSELLEDFRPLGRSSEGNYPIPIIGMGGTDTVDLPDSFCPLELSDELLEHGESGAVWDTLPDHPSDGFKNTLALLLQDSHQLTLKGGCRNERGAFAGYSKGGGLHAPSSFLDLEATLVETEFHDLTATTHPQPFPHTTFPSSPPLPWSDFEDLEGTVVYVSSHSSQGLLLEPAGI